MPSTLIRRSNLFASSVGFAGVFYTGTVGVKQSYWNGSIGHPVHEQYSVVVRSKLRYLYFPLLLCHRRDTLVSRGVIPEWPHAPEV